MAAIRDPTWDECELRSPPLLDLDVDQLLACLKARVASTPVRARDSIAAGISDSERSNASNLLPTVNPTFNWVRLAQRIPVRVRLDRVPPGVALIVGRTATVTVDPAAPAAAGSAGR